MGQTVHVTSGDLSQFYFGSPGTLTTAAPAATAASYKRSPWSTFQLTSAAAATAVVQGSNDDLTGAGTNTNWVTIGTITLGAAGTDGFATMAPWKWVRFNVTVASAATSCMMGV
jgi:hypothetical protein